MTDILFASLIPLAFYWSLTAISLFIALIYFIRSPRNGIVRLIAIVFILLALANPQKLEKTVSPLENIVLILKDETGSQTLDQRAVIANDAEEKLRQRLEAMDHLSYRLVRLDNMAETPLFQTLNQALSDIPAAQLSAIFIISDGIATDTAQEIKGLTLPAPIHLLHTGRPDEIDRQLEIISAPRYGIINETVQIKFRVNDTNTQQQRANLTLLVNGVEALRQPIQVNEDVTLNAPLSAPGKAVIELSAEPIAGELTQRNNHATAQISVIRDRLRVLLISGEPHAGERTWRNLLKSDPAVDLIHFTILKPATKQRAVAGDDLALIPFPDRELFLERLNQFDVVIFDRYTYRGVLSPLHFDNIARYIENGGALLIAAGPEFSGRTSLAHRQNLSYLLPALPNGQRHEAPFQPQLNNIGQRHPVTRHLPAPEIWGRWLRSIGVNKRSGQTLMETENREPLLILDRVGEGRIALLLSDHVWLWARNFDGGGPHRELLRRLVHWLMKEPELEEEALTLKTAQENGATQILISRRSLQDDIAPILLQAPDGGQQQIELRRAADSTWQATTPASLAGLYSATTQTASGRTLYDIIAAGLATPPEFSKVLSTSDILSPLVKETQGGIYNIRRGENSQIPSLRYISSGRAAAGRGADTGWAGIINRKAQSIDAIKSSPLLPSWAWLFISMLTIIAAWLIESRILFTKLKPNQQ